MCQIMSSNQYVSRCIVNSVLQKSSFTSSMLLVTPPRRKSLRSRKSTAFTGAGTLSAVPSGNFMSAMKAVKISVELTDPDTNNVRAAERSEAILLAACSRCCSSSPLSETYRHRFLWLRMHDEEQGLALF